MCKKQGNKGLIRSQNAIALYLAHKQHVPYKCAKYTCRTIAFSLLIRPLFPCFLQHCCIRSLLSHKERFELLAGIRHCVYLIQRRIRGSIFKYQQGNIGTWDMSTQGK